ncbi:unnamed protein product [Dovyalis caffra]|uniref:Ribosomal protein L33 n=1 Tax=Dovyalis caffra TaxID=77055 RepID=A0AAV1R8V9_9ROSI|nr:unnamed protein product [Dovyalis caffra]
MACVIRLCKDRFKIMRAEKIELITRTKRVAPNYGKSFEILCHRCERNKGKAPTKQRWMD